jgi:YVTN family beta-propeller protein
MIATLALTTTFALLAPPAAAPAATPAPQPATDAAPAAGPFRVLRTIELGGEGGWDCIEIDAAAHRVYVPHATRVVVVDTETGKAVGEVADTAGVHDVALAPALGKGFTSNGKTDDVTVFDLATLKAVATVKAGKNPDAIIFEPVTKRVFCFNGKGNDATVIGAEDLKVAGTVAVGGKPELAVVDGQGNVWVNVEDTSEVLRIDAKSMTVAQRIPLAPGEEPTGLAIDPAAGLLFAACGNQKMAVVDTKAGKVVATPAIGSSPDGAGFDPVGHFAFASNGEGTLTVVRTDGAKPFEVVQTLPTTKGARTMVVDPKAQRIYLPAADYEAAAEGGKGKRPKMKPGSFKLVVVGT